MRAFPATWLTSRCCCRCPSYYHTTRPWFRRPHPHNPHYRHHAFVPPSPSALGPPRAARYFPSARRWGRRLLILSAVGGTIYLADQHVYASGLARSMRTFATGLLVALDYKLNFRATPLPLIGSAGGIPALHRRSAERLSDLLHDNGGLYLKIGQAIAMQSALLPPEFQRMFARMFDDAPQAPWHDVARVVEQDFGVPIDQVFGLGRGGVIERTARASASVAQVHWARLPDGREVAVKIQKPEIARQIGWDLWAFRVVMRIYSTWFDLPLYSQVPFITERLMLETDFENEACNAEAMRQLVSAEPSLRDRVYVPSVYPELSSKRVMSAEWIEGVRLWDKQSITRPWRGGYGQGSPGVDGTFADAPLVRGKAADVVKPARAEWRGPRHQGGLGLSTKEVIGTMVDLFAAQIFKWGVVHCDPHPGNIFIRRLPSGRAQLVLLDHGLYVYLNVKFRQEYCVFWKALLTLDNQTVARVAQEWGIKAADIFASATLMRPYEGGRYAASDGTSFRTPEQMVALQGQTPSERHFEMQQRLKQGIRDILADEDRWPKELIFLGRNMRIVQANNQHLGSPVNRIKRMGQWASRSLYQDPARPARERLQLALRHFVFMTVLAVSDVVFYTFRLRQWLGWGGGMEDAVEARMRVVAQDYGVDLQHEVFEG